MSELVLTDGRARKADALRKTVLKKQRGRGSDGEMKMLYRLEASSGQFDLQFTKAFKLSVARARKAQKDMQKKGAA